MHAKQANPDTHSTVRFIRLKQVAAQLGCSVRRVQRLVKSDPDFPKPLDLGPNMKPFVQQEIDAYTQAKMAARTAPGASLDGDGQEVAVDG